MFPSFLQRIRIAIKGRCNLGKRIIIAVHVLNLNRVSNFGEYGFLPTFGPSFIHFYSTDNTSTKKRSVSDCSSAGIVYCGRVLLSLKTEIEEPEVSSATGVEVEPATPIFEKNLWKSEEYLLFGIFYDVCMIDRSRFKNKLISFEISLGNAGNHKFRQIYQVSDSSDSQTKEKTMQSLRFHSQTQSRATGTNDGEYNYLPLASSKPCVYVKSIWPNFEWRNANSNHLQYIANTLEKDIEKLESEISSESSQVHETYNKAMNLLMTNCTLYIQMLEKNYFDEDGGTTKLDRHRINLCRREIEDVVRMVKVNGELLDKQFVKIAMVHAYQYLHKIRDVVEDPQHNLPDVFIWMIAGTKRVAYARLPAKSVLYAKDDKPRGEDCGRVLNLFMKNPENSNGTIDYSACKAEVFLWLGNVKFSRECLAAVPPGHDVDSETGDFPRFVKYVEFSKFQLRAHIFQGRFELGMDASGLLDPFVRVIFQGHSMSTRVIKQSLNPFWDQTLVFPPINLYGTREHTKSIPPGITMEAFDEDLCDTIEFCGRCITTPTVKLATEAYRPPNFPARLSWCKLESQQGAAGSILAAFELIEIGDNQIVNLPLDPSKEKIYRVPDNIRPKMINHRLEVMFWGVRDLKKMCFMPVQNPEIVVECSGVHVKSIVAENGGKSCNFQDHHFIIDLDLPEDNIYSPPITIKSFDSGGFGCRKFRGVCIVPTANVFFQKLFAEEEYEKYVFDAESSLKNRWPKTYQVLPENLVGNGKVDENSVDEPSEKPSPDSRISILAGAVKRRLSNFVKPRNNEHEKDKVKKPTEKDNSKIDWWEKYLASIEEEKIKKLDQEQEVVNSTTMTVRALVLILVGLTRILT